MTTLQMIRHTVKGAAILKDWLGDGGKPVYAEWAERRAMTCVSCIHNVAPNWWTKHTNAIALAIRRHLAVKATLDLSVKGDDLLGMCKLCGCANKLSIWAPLKHIRKHTSEDQLSKLPSHCWKLTETDKP